MKLKLSDLEKELLGLCIMETVINSKHYNSSEKECLEAIYHRIKTPTLVKESPQFKYYSERGFPLITQSFLDSSNKSKGMLTVENYDKWYQLYRITREGEVKPIDYRDMIESRTGLTWVDHAVSPEAFHLTAQKLDLEYDDRTFAMVCERFVTDYLEDWSKLAYHLPVEDK